MTFIEALDALVLELELEDSDDRDIVESILLRVYNDGWADGYADALTEEQDERAFEGYW